MKRNLILTGILAVAVCLPASATIINIPDDYPTIQQGIDASSDGDTVLVQPGTYVENINFNGHNIVLGSLFLTTGDTTYISRTIIDGDSSGSVVTFEYVEDSTAAVIGFSIQNGNAHCGGGIYCHVSHPLIANNHIRQNIAAGDYYYMGNGGGIYCYASSPRIIESIIIDNIADKNGAGIHCQNHSNPFIMDNIISADSSGRSGGGIYCSEGSEPTISNNSIIGNKADIGGGICTEINSNPDVNRNTIIGNSANLGGGIYFYNHCRGLIDHNIISFNLADSGGAGIFCNNFSDPLISNNVIYNNISSNNGGGIWLGFDSNAVIRSNTICNNSVSNEGGGIYCFYYSSPEIYNTILWNNSAGGASEIYFYNSDPPRVSYCDIFGGYEGEGNLNVEPLFRDPENGDFHLMSTDCGDPEDSPCIDVGHPSLLDSTLSCSWGLGNLTCDMGAYGGGASRYRTINIPNDYPTIQEGIYASQSGDTLLVQPGTYMENIDFSRRNIVFGSLFLTTGDTSYVSTTIINGTNPGPVVNLENEEDSTACITGFTIQNGFSYNGHGIRCYAGSTPQISNNIIKENLGSGIFCMNSPTKIDNNLITDNDGQGIYCGNFSNSTITNNIISNNGNGGIRVPYSEPIIINNVITGNVADYNGAAISCNRDLVLMGNTIYGNATSEDGGGIYCWLESSPTIINTIFWGNSPNEIVINEGSPTISYCDIQGGWAGEGNIDADPLFRDPDNGDFHLMSTACGDPYDSPCIDAGDPSIEDILLDCSWGLGTVLSDIGAYGGGDSTTVGIDDDDVYVLPDRLLLMQNYPNPFNATTVIRYALQEAADVRIEIYDILGRKVETLTDGEKPAGNHTIIWKPDDYPSGVYFAILEGGKRTDSIKMVFLK